MMSGGEASFELYGRLSLVYNKHDSSLHFNKICLVGYLASTLSVEHFLRTLKSHVFDREQPVLAS